MKKLNLFFVLILLLPAVSWAQWGLSGGRETRKDGSLSEGYIVRLERPFSVKAFSNAFQISYSARLQAGYVNETVKEELSTDIFQDDTYEILEGSGAFLMNMNLSQYFVFYGGYGYSLEQIIQSREASNGTDVAILDDYFMGHGSIWGLKIKLASLQVFWERRNVKYLEDTISPFATSRSSVGIGFGF